MVIKSSRKRLLFSLISVTLFTLLLLWATMQSAAAFSGFLSAFGTAYPSSTSNSAGCQLCHQGASGGNGWNAYGWSVRELVKDVDSPMSIEDAMAAVETADADGNGISNIDEINANAQPGWGEGSSNTIFFSDGTTSADQAPPDGITPIDGEPTHVSFSGQQTVTTTIFPLIVLFTLLGMLTVGIRSEW